MIWLRKKTFKTLLLVFISGMVIVMITAVILLLSNMGKDTHSGRYSSE